jgi:hypothetical protein
MCIAANHVRACGQDFTPPADAISFAQAHYVRRVHLKAEHSPPRIKPLIRNGIRISAGASQVHRPRKGWSGRRTLREIPSQSIHDQACIYPLTLLQWITRNAAKKLVREARERQLLAKKEPRDQYPWGEVPLDKRRCAIAEVNAALDEEHISVAEETIKERLKKAMKDVQRSEQLPQMCLFMTKFSRHEEGFRTNCYDFCS